MTQPVLAAIRFDTGDIDAFLGDIAQSLRARGLRLSGALQSRGQADGACHCPDMDLHSIASDVTFRISQPLGNSSRGCRLHPGALAQCAVHLEAELSQGADLLILNRFGRGESHGRGFRDLIGAALMRDIPVLTAVRPTYFDAWAAFGAGLACDLPMRRDAVLDWFEGTHSRRLAA